MRSVPPNFTIVFDVVLQHFAADPTIVSASVYVEDVNHEDGSRDAAREGAMRGE